jgi:putative NADPH-quinone reductase
MTKILVINGHPDGNPARLCAGLATAYADAAQAAGHKVRRIGLGNLDFPLIASREAFEEQVPPDVIGAAQRDIRWADHLVLVHPIWLGGPPAKLKGFLEQVFRYGFALAKPGSPKIGGLLGGRSARVVATMGMPAVVYRAVFGAFGVRAVERGIFRLSGIHPIHHTLIGGVEDMSAVQRQRLVGKIASLGRRGA